MMKDLALLDRLIAESALDSVQIAALKKALGFSREALSVSQRAEFISELIRKNDQELMDLYEQRIHFYIKEIRKQKFLKWTGIVVTAVVVTIAFKVLD